MYIFELESATVYFRTKSRCTAFHSKFFPFVGRDGCPVCSQLSEDYVDCILGVCGKNPALANR